MRGPTKTDDVVSSSVPLPVLFRVAALALLVDPLKVKFWAEATSIPEVVPSARVKARAELKLLVTASVPPLSVMPPLVAPKAVSLADVPVEAAVD